MDPITDPAGTPTPPAENNAAQTPPVTAPEGTGNQPDWKALAQEWEKRAKGFQRTAQNEQTARMSLEEQAKAFQEQVTGLTKERDEAVTKLPTLQEELTTHKTKATLLEEELNRIKLIADEFPQFLPAIKTGSIPEGSGDDLRQKLTALVNLMQGTAQNTALNNARNVVPPPPPSSGNIADPSGLLRQAMDALRAGNTADYDRLYTEYLNTKK